MKKILIFGLVILCLILSLNLVSADICRGSDGYYHDCDDYRYFDGNYGYDDHYYYHGKYYPARDYYYRDFYGPRYKTKRYDTEIDYIDVEEYKRTINYEYEDRYGTQKYKTTINQKTEIELDYEIPYYVVYDYRNKDDGDYNDEDSDKWHDFWYDDYLIPYTSYWYKNN